MCENIGTGLALDMMAFTLSHSTDARNALSLYEAANGKTGKTVEDVVLPGIIETSEDSILKRTGSVSIKGRIAQVRN